MDRREFLAKAGLVATWAGVTVTVAACNDDSTMSPSTGGTGGGTGGGGTGGGGATDVSGTVTGGGHTHSGAVVTAAEITAGNAVTLTLAGSGHTHTVQLSAQDVMDVGAGTQVARNTALDSTGHMHTVTFN